MRKLLALAVFWMVSHPVYAEQSGGTCDVPKNVTTDVSLTSGCVYAGPITITSSNVTLDCAGATIDATGARNGIVVFGSGIHDVTIKNCIVDGAKNEGIFVKPPLNAPQMAALPMNERYAIAPRSIVITKSVVTKSGTAGVYVGNYAQDTRLSEVEIKSSGSIAVYLDASSVSSTIENSTFENNGFGDPLGRNKQEKNREAIAIDSSAHNTIRYNVFRGNSAGGIFLYKNCWERHDDPKQVPRWQHSDFNLIQGNDFTEKVGVWIASRQARNMKNMNCGDPPLAPNYFRDYADHNTVENNTFNGGDIAINVQGDFTTIKGNRFSGQAKACVLLGSSLRDKLTGQSIESTSLLDNECEIDRANSFVSEGASKFSQCSGNLADGSKFACR